MPSRLAPAVLHAPARASGRWLGAVGLAALLGGCGSSAVRQAPGKPPTPTSVSVAEPGGDAHDPHRAALERQLTAPWGRRNDKDDQLHVPTPDWEHWKRVRYWGIDHFSGWRYGDEHHLAAVAFLVDAPTDEDFTSAACLRKFDAAARPKAKALGVVLDDLKVVHGRWREHRLVIEVAEGHLDSAFQRESYSAAWTAYPAYPARAAGADQAGPGVDTCLIYAVAIPWRKHGELAKQVRDRWVAEGFSRMLPRTTERPVRK